MLIPAGKVIASGRVNSRPPFLMKKLMKRCSTAARKRRTREKRCNLEQEKFRLRVRKSFFKMETAKWGNRLSKEVMFHSWRSSRLSHAEFWVVSSGLRPDPAPSTRLKYMASWGPFQIQSYDPGKTFSPLQCATAALFYLGNMLMLSFSFHEGM